MKDSNNKPIGRVIGLKIERYNPENSPKNLAMQLASAVNEELNARNDSQNYRSQASRERQKAKQFGDILVMLREYNLKKKNSDNWKPSRMEPMESYDEEEIKKERSVLIDRAKQLEDQAIEFDKIADGARKKSIEIQKKLQLAMKESDGST